MTSRPLSRDFYTQDVDFTALALQYPSFAKRLKSNKQLDFSDPESVRQLTKALLHRDFNLAIDLPVDRLCPPVPNRFNYILWIQDLLDSTSDDFRERHDPGREIIGLDIGTGASAIYPLLACRQHVNWKFVVTENDPVSAKYAVRNITTNGLQNRIKMAPVKDAGPLLPDAIKSLESIDFVMTNPPFYASEAEMVASAEKKQRPPFSACTGASMEMITPGGEVAFVSKIIEESTNVETREKIQWFTSMLGKLASVSTLVDKLRNEGCVNYAVTEFVQGQKTRRWAVAWSWQDLKPSAAVARGIPGFEKKLLPFPANLEFDLAEADLDALGMQVNEVIRPLDLHFKWNAALAVGVGVASGDVWSRKARRRKAKDDTEDHETAGQSEDDDIPTFAFKISLNKGTSSVGSAASRIHVRWLQGRDAVLFESFCGWLKRKSVAL